MPVLVVAWLVLALVAAASRRPRPRVRWRLAVEPPKVTPRPPWAAPAVLVIAAAFLWLPLALALGVALWARPRIVRHRRAAVAARAVARELPEVVDLLAVAVAGGATVAGAVATVGAAATGPVAAALARASEETSRGRRLADALDDVPRRVGEGARSLATALSAGERYGTPLTVTLERLADDARQARRREAEAAARRVPVQLLFPLVCCILPAFALLTVAPLIAGAFRSLRL